MIEGREREGGGERNSPEGPGLEPRPDAALDLLLPLRVLLGRGRARAGAGAQLLDAGPLEVPVQEGGRVGCVREEAEGVGGGGGGVAGQGEGGGCGGR